VPALQLLQSEIADAVGEVEGLQAVLAPHQADLQKRGKQLVGDCLVDVELAGDDGQGEPVRSFGDQADDAKGALH